MTSNREDIQGHTLTIRQTHKITKDNLIHRTIFIVSLELIIFPCALNCPFKLFKGHSNVERGDDKAGIKKDYDHKLTSSAVFGVFAWSESIHITSFIFTEL